MLPERGLDGLERVGLPDDSLDRPACRAAERDGGLKRPVGGALARLVRDQEREGARTFVRFALEIEAVGRPDVATIAVRALSKLVMYRVTAGGEALNDEAAKDV